MVMRFARQVLTAAAVVGVTIFFLVLLFTNNEHNDLTPKYRDRLDFMEKPLGQLRSDSIHDKPGIKMVESEDRNRKAFHHETGSGSQPLMRILVLTYNRGRSLWRCLNSINDAEYDGQRVEVEIHVDRGKDGKAHNETVNVANSFRFRHGAVRVHVQPRHVGVLGQWLGTWRVPRDNSTEIAVFVEDDITLSPYFARWLRMVHKKYDGYPGINGYTLQAESIRHAVGASTALLKGPPGEVVFLYPVLGSWGFSPNVAAWRDFLKWYKAESGQQRSAIPYVAGLKPSLWYRDLHKTGRADSMWTMWHIAHAYQKKLYTVYPNLPNGKALAFNWKEPGEHYSDAVAGKGLHANLLDTWDEKDLLLPENLIVLDAKGENTGKILTPVGFRDV